MSIATASVKPKRALPRRAVARQSYREPLYDSDYESVPEKEPSRHSARIQAAYEDLSNTDAQSLSEHNELPPPTRKARRPRPTKRKTRSTTTMRETIFHDFKRRKVDHTYQKSKATPKPSVHKTKTHFRIKSRGVIPRWQDLEYQILVKILKFAAYPLYIGASNDTGSTKWLLRVSTLSHSFHEAALGALLFSPPLMPPQRAHSLMRLLKLSREEFGDNMDEPKQKKSTRISTDYRKLIRHLSIEARNLLVSKPALSLDELLQHTPVLKSLIFYHNHDVVVDKVIWAHPNYSRAKNKWQYTQLYPVLAGLQHTPMLQEFEWNARFLTKDDGVLSHFYEIHKTTEHFNGLKSVTLRNFLIDGVEKLNETVVGTSLVDGPNSKANTHQARLITWRLSLKEALNKYTKLERLSICNSNVFDSASLTTLPANLRRLEIENCPCVNSEGMQAYLSKGVGQLQELVLRGNQYLSLAFIATLKEHAPKLTMLDIDLNYKDPTSYQDTEPLFDSLLPDGPPTWPVDLECISIGPLRRLSTQDAESFYQSLIDTAEQLKYLRVLELRTLLNEAGWRDRAALRTKWTAKFDEVFNVKHNPGIRPPSLVTSLPSPKVEVQVIVKNVKRRAVDEVPRAEGKVSLSPRRKSRRIEDLALSDSQGQLSDSQNEPLSPTYSSLLEEFDGEDRNSREGEAQNATESDTVVRQGRCHTVVFELSDQRPAQDQFREDDFLDDEADLEEDGDWRA